MKSWAVTRGPSLDPAEKRLAVHVEDHPIEYNTFEGTIPQGEYGGGTVMIWDRGRWLPEGDPHKGYAKGHLEFTLDGEKLHGRWHLVRMRTRDKDRHENWLLIKGKDEEARSERSGDILEEEPLSAVSGRSMEEIAEGKGKKRVWHSNRGADPPSDFRSLANATRIQGSIAGGGRVARKEKFQIAGQDDDQAGKKVSDQGNNQTKARAETAACGCRGEARGGGGSAQTLGLTAARRQKQAIARFRSAESGDAARHRAKRGGLDPRDQIRRLPHRSAARSRQGQAAHAQSSSIGRIASSVLPRRSPRCRRETALLDGELVVENDKGVSSFSMLQTDLKEGRGDRFVYWVFDLLYLDGRDLTDAPLIARKAALQRLLKGEQEPGRSAMPSISRATAR